PSAGIAAFLLPYRRTAFGSCWLDFARHRLIERLEHAHSSPQQGVIVAVRAAETLHQPSDRWPFGLAVVGFLQIQIVEVAPDALTRRVTDRESFAEGFERAMRPVMPELGFERVVGNRL